MLPSKSSPAWDEEDDGAAAEPPFTLASLPDTDANPGIPFPGLIHCAIEGGGGRMQLSGIINAIEDKFSYYKTYKSWRVRLGAISSIVLCLLLAGDRQTQPQPVLKVRQSSQEDNRSWSVNGRSSLLKLSHTRLIRSGRLLDCRPKRDKIHAYKAQGYFQETDS